MARPSYKEMMTILGRTKALRPEELGIAVMPGDVSASLSFTAAEMAQTATGLVAVKDRLAASFAGPKGTAAAAPAAGWLRQTVVALRPFPQVAQAAGVTGAQLGELLDRQTALVTIASHAGAAKDGAMDARAIIGGFGWHIVQAVLDGLRSEVAGLAAKEAEVVLEPFVPLFLLLRQMTTEKSALEKTGKQKADRLSAEVEEAQIDKADAEAALSLREGKAPRAVLLERARREAAPAAVPRRRTRR